MRKALTAAILIAGAQGALAADMPNYPLRGGYSDGLYARSLWQGFYIGGQASSAWIEANPSSTYNSAIEAEYRARTNLVYPFPTLANASGRSSSGYGGFAGYNTQWEDVVVGVEANYLHQDIAAFSNNTLLNYFTDGSYVSTTSNASVRFTDFGSFRLRAGYMMGNFLPYAFVGVAGGLANFTQSAGVTGTTTIPSPLPAPLPALSATSQIDRALYGYSAGLGVDIALFGGLFVRAEYEYLRFTSKLDTVINNVKVGVGYKF